MKKWILGATMCLSVAHFGGAEEVRRLLLPLPHTTEVKAMAFSKEKKRLATGDTQGLVKIWNWNQKAVEMSIRPAHGDERGIEWLDWVDDTLLVVGRSDSQVRVYDVTNGDERSILQLENSGKAALLPGQQLAVSITEGDWGARSQVPVIHVYDLKDKKLLRKLSVPGVEPNGHWVKSLAASRDGKRLAISIDPIGPGPNRLVEIDSQTGDSLRSADIEGGYAPEAMTYSPNDRMLAGRSWDLVIWTENGVKVVKPDRAGLKGVDWVSDQELVFNISNNGATLHRLKLPGLEQGPSRPVEGGWASAPVVVSPEGIPTFTTLEGHLFNAETGAQLVKAPAVNGVNCAAYHPKGRLITGLQEGDALVWDLTTGKQERRFQVPGIIRGLALTEDGTKLAITTNHDNDLRLFDWASGRLTKTFKTDCVQGDGYTVRFSPDGSKLAVVQSKPPGWASELLLFDVASGERLWKPEKTFRFAFHPRENKWAVLRQEGLVEIDLNTGDEVMHRIKNLKDCAYDNQGNLYGLQNTRSGGESRLLKMYAKKTGRLDEGQVVREWYSTSFKKLVYQPRDGGWWLQADSGAIYHVDAGGKDRFRIPDRVVAGSWAVLPNGMLACPGSEGTLEFWKGSQTSPEGQLVVLGKGQNWLVTSAGGYFDGTNEAEQLLEWQVGKQRYRVDQFFQQGFRPGLLREFYRGVPVSRTAGPLTQVSTPPQIEILSPAPGARVEGREVEIRVKLVDQGHGYSSPRLFVNGHALAATRTRSEGANQYVFKARLQPGVNEVRATGFDSSGMVESRGDRLRLTCMAEARRKPILHVVAVGVNQASAGRPLQFAEKDAQAIAEQLRKQAAGQAEVHLLCGKAATKASLDEVFRKIEAAAEPQDTLVTFLAGHGVSENSGYRFLLSGQKVELDSITSSELASYFESVPAQRQLVVLDTCHSAAATPDLASRFAISQQRLARGSGTFLLAACRSNETAAEIASLQHGLLTYSLLNGFTGKGAHTNAQGQITVNSLIQYVSSNFPEITRRHEQNQELFQFTNGSDFPLALAPRG